MDRKYKTYVAMLHEWPWEQAQHYLEKQISSGKDYTVHEWIDIIEHHPEAADYFVPWKDYTPEKWAVFLGRMPQFADQCPCFDQFLPKQWSRLLAAHPEMERRGVCFDQFTEKDWRDLCNRNTDFFMHRENWTLRDELRPAFFLRDYLIKRKRLLIDLQAAANICDDNNERYQIIGVDTDISRPRTWEFKKEEIDRILAPFRHEQKAVYRFLSSGETNGILNKFGEMMAHELPLKNRNDLENLIAIAQPGPLMYWEEYKENRPCRLAVASEITKRTRGLLLYKEQQLQAIQLMTGCSLEDATLLWTKNIGMLLNRPYKELFLHLIADYNGITREKAEEILNAWRSYGPYSVRYDIIKKKTHGIFLCALDYLRKNGTKGLKDRKSTDEDQPLPGFQELDS